MVDIQDRYGDKNGKEPSKIVVSFRSKETMILNVLELAAALKQKYEDVEVVELSHTSFEDRARIMSRAKVFISVVSDDLTAMAMLPKDSTVISIVPFGNPDRVWRRMAKRFGVNYVFWKNEDREKAAFHPEILKEYNVVGEEAEKIVKADKYVPDEQSWVGEFYWNMVFVFFTAFFVFLPNHDHNVLFV